MPGGRGTGPNGCCCKGGNTGYCTTRKYDPNGNQLWTADFGIDTVDVALDSMNNAHVVGPRVKDITIQNTTTGGSGVNAVQTIVGVQCDTGSQFRVSLDGYRTALLDWNCTASDLQTALEALSNIGTGNVAVSGTALGPTSILIVTFQGSLAGTAVNLMQLETFKLLGLPTVKTYSGSDGSELLEGYTESTPTRIRYTNGYLYVTCNRSAGLRLVMKTANTVYRLEAFGELSGGSFRLYRSISPLRLEVTGDVAYNCAASDVQTALRNFTAYGTAVACTGGPLPFAPITITFTTDPTNNFNGAALDIEQGNLTGGVSFYKLSPSDLSQQWAVNAGFSNCNALATDSGGKIYVGGRAALGSSEVTLKGENQADSIQDDSDVLLRQYDNSGSPQTLGIKNHGGSPNPVAVDTSGNVFVCSRAWHKVYKLYLSGTVTGGTFQMAVGGSPITDSLGHIVNFPYNVWNSKPGTPTGTGVADYLGAAGFTFFCLGDRDLSVSPIWIYPDPVNQQIYGALTIYASSITGGGSVNCDVVNVGQSAFTAPSDRITKYDSSGNQVATATFITSVTDDGQISGQAFALDSSQRLCVSPWDDNNSSVLTLLSNDIQTVIWRAVLSGSLSGNSLPHTFCCGFDSSDNVFQAGTLGNTSKSTRKFDNSTPPNLLWQKDHGIGSNATGTGQDPSVLGLGITTGAGADNLVTTGVRVSLAIFP